MMSRISGMVLAVVIVAASASAASAGNRPMLTRGETSPPIGAVQFCHDNPGECSRYGRPDEVVRLSQKSYDKLRSINASVNRAVIPATDQETYGKVEHWTYPGLMGDCEDYALEKRRMLVKAGWPDSALLLTVVRDEVGDGHAILTVRTDRGDLILDNKTDRVLLWHQTPYRFVKRQSSRTPSAWQSVDDSRDVLVGSVR